MAVNDFLDNHDFTILNDTSKTRLAIENYSIVTMQFSYKKPAHYMAEGSYSNKVDGYRFNYKKYNLENTGNTTVNNTGHNISDTKEIVDLQINVANCGITLSTNKYKASNAIGYINLSKKYYSSLKINPNGGTHNGKNSSYTYGTQICGTAVKIESPIRKGYQFTGWTLSKGSSCLGASFNSNTSKFTYCGESISSTNVESGNTCTLTANWQHIEIPLPEAGGKPKDIIFIIIGIILILSIIYKKKRRKR